MTMRTLLTIGFASLLLSCADPVRDKIIDDLGAENPAVPQGEYHRPGQPCVACHSNYGPGSPLMSIGGTVYVKTVEGEFFAAGGVTVRLIDSEGEVREKVTNCIGNFYLTKQEWDPAFPLQALLFGPSAADPDTIIGLRNMESRISRDGSCAGCHTHPRTASSPGLVFVDDGIGAIEPPTADCPGAT